MARHTLAVGELHHPSDLTPTHPLEVISKPSEDSEPESVIFVKNLNTREKLKLSDGSIFVFPGQTFACSDQNLIKHLREVAEKAHIVEK